MASVHPQDRAYALASTDPIAFWAKQAEHLYWHKQPYRTIETKQRCLKNGIIHDDWTWFPGGEISTTYNCVDRHVLNGNGSNVAIYWDSAVTGARQQFTYKQLLTEVEVLAGVLKGEDIKQGDVVLVYMPMIPAALFAMLAIARLGGIHSVVFGGFASTALAQRIEACSPKVIMTASCGIEGGKGALPYKGMIEEALKRSSFKPNKTIIWQRDELRWNPILKEDRQSDWQALVKCAKKRKVAEEAVAIKSEDALYIIYTSGTTGRPKGVVRTAGGHAVGLNHSIKSLFGIHGPGDVMFAASDIGWVVGHSYIVYAPLLVGAATVLFEGKPIGTPDAGTFWRIVEDYKVTALFTAPTALRAIRREDSQNDFFENFYGKRGGLKSLRGLFLAGERSEPAIVQMYQNLLDKHCARDAMVIDNWWSSESGSPISGIAIAATVSEDFSIQEHTKALPIKPGSAGKPLPGFSVEIVDDDGKPVKRGQMGNIVMAIPLAPTAFTTLWGDPDRFYESYLKRFNGRWLDTGDAGMIDKDGYVSVMARSDDVLNVAAHRFSTGAIEQAIMSHPNVAEAAVVGVPDQLKGTLPFAFISLVEDTHGGEVIPSVELTKEVQKQVREQIGAIASLGGIIQGNRIIPKTRSGKILRRVLRELLENATHGQFDKEIAVPSTIEDREVIKVAKAKVAEYFFLRGNELHKPAEVKAKL